MPRLLSQQYDNSLYAGAEVGGLVYIAAVLLDEQRRLTAPKNIAAAVLVGGAYGLYDNYLKARLDRSDSFLDNARTSDYAKPKPIDITKPPGKISILPYPRPGGASIAAGRVPVLPVKPNSGDMLFVPKQESGNVKVVEYSKPSYMVL